MMHCRRATLEARRREDKKMTQRRQKDTLHSNFATKNHKEHEVYKSQGNTKLRKDV
jgi:hypothetical protein